MTKSLCWMVLLLGACAPTTAIVNGQPVARQDFKFTGKPFNVRHEKAHPSPGTLAQGVTDYGGHIIGQVCGLDIDYEVKHVGDHIELSGTVDQQFNSQLTVREENGVRLISGTLGADPGISTIELKLATSALAGRVGFREYCLEQKEDLLDGTVTLTDQDHVQVAARLSGRDALWALPPADQAAILPSLLSCSGGNTQMGHQSPIEVKVGGPAGYAPAKTSSIYGNYYGVYGKIQSSQAPTIHGGAPTNGQ